MLYLNVKLDTANFEQKQSSHGGGLDRFKLSSGFGVQRTRDLESLGSKKSIYMVPPL